MRIWRTGAALACAALWLTAANRIDNEVQATQVPGFLCVQYKVFENPGKYCCYYAMECSSSTTPPCGSKVAPYYDSNCSLGSGNCCNPMGNANCFAMSTTLQPDDSTYVYKDLGGTGLAVPLKEDYTPKLHEAKILSNQIGDLETPGGQIIKVRLFQILATKKLKDLPQLIIGDGVEITTKKEADIKIAYDPKTVVFERKVCHINLGHAKYTVFLSQVVKAAPKK